MNAGTEQLFVMTQPNSNPAESMRLLRTDIEFAAAAREISSMAITSAGPGEGKSTVTANLGASMAQAGFTAVVIDADLRRPSQHTIFDLGNDRGLTTLLTHPEHSWRSAATEIVENGLWVIPSGPLPPDTSDLLSSERFRTLIQQIGQQVDIVLVDTPPVLAVADPLIASTTTDGVLLVCRANRTRIEALQRAAAFPDSVRRIGVVLNKQERGGGEGYYYSGYYGAAKGAKPAA